MKKLHLIRHAEVDLKHRSRDLGRSDVPLSDEGIIQAKNLGVALGSEFSKAHFPKGLNDARVWLSPLERCSQTWNEMAIITDRPPRKVSELIEIDIGQWEGKTFQEIVTSNPEQVKQWRD